ncbi:MAG TPA: LysR family transcriptional regulator [Terriglobia bacterium]|nr:LysR family transcriptional regulator [Terriglobia bacterium]
MRQLRVTMDGQIAVLAVAEKGSFEAAGKYLGIGKSAVRKRVHSIESEAGTPLFRIVGKVTVPTEAGSLYLLAARESVRQAWLGLDRVQAFLRAQTNYLRIGYSTYLNTRLLDIIRRIPPTGIGSPSVTRESLLTHQIVAGVLQGDIHVGFGILPILEPDLFTRLLFEEPLMACLPVGHRLATRSTIRPEELADEPMVSIGRHVLPGRYEDIVTHFESLGISLKFTSDVSSLKEALWLITQNAGVSLMTRFSAMSFRYDVVVRPLSDRLLTVKSGILTRRDHDQKLIHDFVELAWAETAALRGNTG